LDSLWRANEGKMARGFVITVPMGILLILLSGCLYRGDGIFNKIGDTDYKAEAKFGRIFVVRGGIVAEVCGTVLLEDRLTPLKYTRVTLTKKDDKAIISSEQTDHIGKFCLAGILYDDYYEIEVNTPEYLGNKVVLVDPGKKTYLEVFVHKK
jgi:hypothetical protein